MYNHAIGVITSYSIHYTKLYEKLNFLCSIMVLVTVFLTACGTQKSGEIALTDIVEGSQESTAGSEDEVSTESIEIQLFVAASLKGAIEEIITNYA